MNSVELKDSYWASVSGGKDSLYMFRLILEHPDKYPLNGVVHFELEIDYPWVKNVIKLYEDWCKQLGIPFITLKPRRSWYELEQKWGFPTRQGRWCNSSYKLDCKRQFEKQFKGISNIKWYIGFCVDEQSRLKNDIYPLVEEGISENKILQWARTVSLFNNFYDNCERQGCMWCPLSSMKEKAYLLKYYPEFYNEMIEYIKKFEHTKGKIIYHKPIEEIDKRIKEKYLRKVL